MSEVGVAGIAFGVNFGVSKLEDLKPETAIVALAAQGRTLEYFYFMNELRRLLGSDARAHKGMDDALGRGIVSVVSGVVQIRGGGDRRG